MQKVKEKRGWKTNVTTGVKIRIPIKKEEA